MDFFPAGHPLTQALIERNYTEPTAVQTAVLEPGAQGRDLLVSAQTGSGKTVAYGLAIASTLLGDEAVLEPATEPLALIVAPTRELALQVHRELAWLYGHAGAKVVSCVGGMDPRAETRRLAEGCHIVVGTPGRLRDHLERGNLAVGRLKAVVLDEADEMLDLGFREDLEFLLEATPQERRTLLFSATLPKAIVTLAKRYQREAWRIAVAAGKQGHADIEYRAISVAPNEVEHAVVNLLRYVESPATLVFCNTRESVRHLQAILLERGFAAVALSGELGQGERNQALQALRDGRARVCVATDVAARGIDLPNIGLVIHAELPQNAQTLQHRSGRTGRAGRKGISVLLVLFSRKRRAEQLLETAGVRAQWGGAPSADDIRALDQERLLQSPLVSEDLTEDDLAMAKALLAVRSPEEIAAALVRMYRAQLPAAEDVFAAGTAEPSPEPRTRRPASRDRDRDGEREPMTEPRPGRNSGLSGPSVCFRLNVGRQKNADPRWLVPMICRLGKITKQEIGAISIFERDTKIEIAAAFAERFIAAVGQVERGDIRIDPWVETSRTKSADALEAASDEAIPAAPRASAPRVTKPYEPRAPRSPEPRAPRAARATDRPTEARPPRASDRASEPRAAKVPRRTEKPAVGKAMVKTWGKPKPGSRPKTKQK
ncbi:DEAD/DEAH box helicase [Rhodospirillum rubrum]|uniref:DEAD/DEAH box helicase n=1 Tax=Rhodospirillum rubrum TaxID=1085 RepID=UPI001906CA2B|nr:DEAD/DEAH box helicase [Rhodospirillum rubrum]MBK1662941.1 DEAD/DEAH box helicase [Rhodospirillum rubrum]MBK1675228.1 DEAD/DEAH box helicase [Rhodospirillum rubrum]